MARPKKPMKVKIAEGNRMKVATAKLTPDIEAKGLPKMPDNMSDLEQAMWARTLGSLPDGILSAAEDGLLERYVRAWARFRTSSIQIANSGILVQSLRGPVRNPLLIVQNVAAKEMHAAGIELGLSPVARARMSQGPRPEEADPMAMLLGDGNPQEAWSVAPKTRQ